MPGSDPPATTAVEVAGEAARAAPRFLLATAAGGVRIHTLPLEGEAVLGRDPDCDVVLDDPSISRRHTRLRLGPTCAVADLGSRNGTRFRGQLLAPGEERELGSGDSFSLGKVSVLLLPHGSSAPTAALGGARLAVDDPSGEDPAGLLAAIARAPVSVIVFGETGVGKEVLAARLHALSGRAGPYVAINCAALTETLLESELFGHERGAFTGAVQAHAGLLSSAAGGSVLLDEIGEMAPALQAKLLRAIETQSIVRVGGLRPQAIDVRFLAATHRDLLAQAETGQFRRDLYYRLAGFTLEIPPLRARRQQIVRLAMEILAVAAARAGAPPPSLSPAASAALAAHDWPGNVRELRNVMTRALVLARGGEIGPEHILLDTKGEPAAAPADERARIQAALEACAGNQTRAAKALGISRTTLLQKLREHRIPRPRSR
jgi:two-component system, NtrC family, response regulator AtoC